MTGRSTLLRRWLAAGMLATACIGPAPHAAAAPARAAAALDVSIVVFDPGVPDDQALHRDLQVFPRIREVEAMLLPFVLRETLVASGQWGAVRIVPEADPAAELLVTAIIGASDGDTLTVRVRAADARGHTWLDKDFTGVVLGVAAKSDGTVRPDTGAMYAQIGAELEQARARLDDAALRDIAEVSLLRYASWLAPSAFGDYLSEDRDGRFSIRRLPARDDPMLERINRVRGTEYVITDAVDAKFRELFTEVAAVYDLWRKYRRRTVGFQRDNARMAQGGESSAPRGSYEALKHLYDNYQRDRVAAQEQDRLAVAFNNEVGPKVAAMESRVAELESWVDQKYAEWHYLLEELFEAETALEK